MRVLSLFDGMGCAYISLKELGIDISRYVAYEIDKYSITASTHNIPMIEHKGDVFKGDYSEYKDFDFLMGGSPCTFWSVAQSPDKRETTNSGFGWELFSQYVRALHEAKPKYFIYENNKSMSKDIRKAIDEAFGFEAVLINSALVSAQNRNRLYWVGKRNDQGWYDKVNVEQPEDRGILLKDILDGAQGAGVNPKGKAHTLTASYEGACLWNSLERSQRSMVACPICVNSQSSDRYNKRPQPSCYDRIYDIEGIIPAITTSHQPPIADYPEHLKAQEVKNGQITIEIKGEPRTYPIKLADGFYTIRKLTVSECMRLQTVPEWYDFSCISKTQAYKCLGNGWTVEIIMHLIRACLVGVNNN